MPYPTQWFPHKKHSVQTTLTQLEWLVLHTVCQQDNLTIQDIAQKLSIPVRKTAGATISLNTKQMLETVGAGPQRTFKLTQQAQAEIFQD